MTPSGGALNRFRTVSSGLLSCGSAVRVRQGVNVEDLDRITFDPGVMGGKPCIRNMRVTVGTVVGLIASGKSPNEVLKLYPYLEADDIKQALAYASWRSEEIDLPLTN